MVAGSADELARVVLRGLGPGVDMPAPFGADPREHEPRAALAELRVRAASADQLRRALEEIAAKPYRAEEVLARHEVRAALSGSASQTGAPSEAAGSGTPGEERTE